MPVAVIFSFNIFFLFEKTNHNIFLKLRIKTKWVVMPVTVFFNIVIFKNEIKNLIRIFIYRMFIFCDACGGTFILEKLITFFKNQESKQWVVMPVAVFFWIIIF